MCARVCVVYVPDHSNKLQPELPDICLSSIVIPSHTIPVSSFPTQPSSHPTHTSLKSCIEKKEPNIHSLLCKSTFFLQKTTITDFPDEMENRRKGKKKFARSHCALHELLMHNNNEGERREKIERKKNAKLKKKSYSFIEPTAQHPFLDSPSSTQIAVESKTWTEPDSSRETLSSKKKHY